MYVNLMVNDDDRFAEYEWKTLSEFLNDAALPNGSIITFDYKGTDTEIHWNEEDLRDNGIWNVTDLYDWLNELISEKEMEER